mmetsp:Transcript_54359/g.129530  ORF Transcript_54359/g.129530 Transcript_54359/m.129530 type:complete len:100 (-) Transcript_54359:1038-1337(-)
MCWSECRSSTKRHLLDSSAAYAGLLLISMNTECFIEMFDQRTCCARGNASLSSSQDLVVPVLPPRQAFAEKLECRDSCHQRCVLGADVMVGLMSGLWVS